MEKKIERREREEEGGRDQVSEKKGGMDGEEDRERVEEGGRESSDAQPRVVRKGISLLGRKVTGNIAHLLLKVEIELRRHRRNSASQVVPASRWVDSRVRRAHQLNSTQFNSKQHKSTQLHSTTHKATQLNSSQGGTLNMPRSTFRLDSSGKA